MNNINLTLISILCGYYSLCDFVNIFYFSFVNCLVACYCGFCCDLCDARAVICSVSLLCNWQVCEYLLGLQKIAGDGFGVNATDSLFGETGTYVETLHFT